MNDVVAKIIFSNPENVSLLEDLVSTILNKKVHIVEVIPEATWIGSRKEEKTTRTDMLIRTEEEWVLFEIQGYKDVYYEQRITSSVARAINMQLKKGKTYHTLKKVVVISIGVGYMENPPGFQGKTVRVLEQYKDIQLFNQVEHYFIDLKKYAELKEIDIHNAKHQWAEFFLYERMEVLCKMAKENDKIREGLEILDKLREDENIWIQIERADEARMLHRLEVGTAKEDGIAIGEKKGIAKTIKNMLKKGMKDDIIKEITGITQKELEEQKALLQV